MNNKAHLKPSDYDNEGNVLPMGYKRLNDGTIINTEEKDDLISRSELKKVLKENEWISDDPLAECGGLEELIDNVPSYLNTYDLGYQDGKNVTLQTIKYSYNNGYEMAKAKFSPKQGEWIKKYKGQVNSFCSECNYEVGRKTNFCPNCGARLLKGGAK